jgi:hypothetical protein
LAFAVSDVDQLAGIEAARLAGGPGNDMLDAGEFSGPVELTGGDGNDTIADRCRDRAFGVLGELVKAGWKDRVALETDPDLEAVRGDPRFRELVHGITK